MSCAGAPIHAELAVDETAGPTRIPVYTAATGVERPILPHENLDFYQLDLVVEDTGPATVFADLYTLPATLTIVDLDNATATLVVVGNHVLAFQPDREFSIAGSTGNNGDYVVASVSYDAAQNETTVVATSGTFPDGTVDGNITAEPTIFAGQTYVAGNFADNGGRGGESPVAFSTPPGCTLYVLGQATGTINVTAHGTLRNIQTEKDRPSWREPLLGQ
jgi:hypothetical protein